MPTSVRLDSKTERLVERLAREKGLTKSAMIREAIAAAAERETLKDLKTPYERVKHLIGCVHDLPPDLSQNTGEKFHQMLLKKHARPR